MKTLSFEEHMSPFVGKSVVRNRTQGMTTFSLSQKTDIQFLTDLPLQ